MTETATPAEKSAGASFLRAVDRVLYPITLGYTGVILGFQLYEFFQGGAFQPRYPMADVYLALLTAYAAQRESSKWMGEDEAARRVRRGELFVGLWFALYLALWALGNLSSGWILPQELKTITLGVLGVFVATGVSSGLRLRAGRTLEKVSASDSDRRVQLLRLLNERGPLSAEGAADALGWPKTSTWRVLEALEKEGRVVQDASRDSRERRYRVAG